MCTPTVQDATAIKTHYNLYNIKSIQIAGHVFGSLPYSNLSWKIQNIAVCHMSLGHATIEGNLEERGHAYLVLG
jgi:hypothetical protein